MQICVTDDTIRYHSCENRENVIYRQVENSMNDLIEIQKEVGNKYESLYGHYKSGTEEYKLLHSLQGSDSSVVDNVVYVYIKDLTVEKEKLYRNLIEDDERIVLVETDGENIEDTSYRPGRSIYAIKSYEGSSFTYSKMSMGYRAKKSSYKFFKSTMRYCYGTSYWTFKYWVIFLFCEASRINAVMSLVMY